MGKTVSVILTNVSQTLICIQITGIFVKNTVSDLAGLQWDLRFYAHKLPGNNDAASQWTMLPEAEM